MTDERHLYQFYSFNLQQSIDYVVKVVQLAIGVQLVQSSQRFIFHLISFSPMMYFVVLIVQAKFIIQ